MNRICRDRSVLTVRPIRKSTGFSLIELMVAIAIALFLVAGMLGIVMSVRGSVKTQSGVADIQDTQRFLLTAIDNTVRLAGYYPNPVVNTATTALPAPTTANPDTTTFVDGQIVIGADGGSDASDSFNVRYRVANNDGLLNCVGENNSSGADIVWTNSYVVNAAHQLTCAVSVNGAAFGDPAILLDNVGSIKVLYGVDSNSDGSVDQYLTATDVQSSNLWQLVLSMQLTITLLNPTATPVAGVAPALPNPLVHTIKLLNQT
jgi:type IV pilus assembly protein PilW